MQFLTSRDVMARLRIGRTKFYALVRSGQLLAIRLGARRLAEEELLRFIASLPPRNSNKGEFA
jgi:excisionase family DNA binding protein